MARKRDHGRAVEPRERTPRVERSFACMLCEDRPEFPPGGEATQHFEEEHPDRRKAGGAFPVTRHLYASFTEARKATQVWYLYHPDTHELLVAETVVIHRGAGDVCGE